MVEVVGDAVVHLDERDAQPAGGVEGDRAVAALDREVRRQRGDRLVEVEDSQADPLERAWLARAFRREERQLAAAGIGADERELVRSVDHVHAHVAGEEVRERVAVLHPESDVIEGLDLHGVEVTHTPQG